MTGRIALVGGDEFLPSCRQMDNELIEATGLVSPRVLIVPTAAATERPELAARHGVQQFEALGADALPLMVVSREDANNDDLTAQVDRAEIVYLTGGNPAHLLDVLRGSLLLRRLEEGLARGMILAGSSAGAMVMGETDALPAVGRRAWNRAGRGGAAASRAGEQEPNGQGSRGGDAGGHHSNWH